MLSIKRIHIRNFRSIVNLSLDVEKMNIFVGLNDAGKSNVLKALNLFFNGKTELGHDFDFNIDYSNIAPPRVNKAKEVVIQIVFSIPETYKDKGDFTWKKVWREDGLFDNGEKQWRFSAKSKLPTLLRRIKYKYVPAVKSNDYFRSLLSDLYVSIAKEVNSDLGQKASDYSIALKTFTHRIGELVKDNIGIDSSLEMPTNQEDIFKELIFMTRDQSARDVDLAFRGDGIKAMHIPAILKYISEQDSKTLSSSSVPYSTIWGYEEPENGIEMSKCFGLAEKFQSYSQEIQLFISTHSPAFYSVGDNESCQVYYVCKDEVTYESRIDESHNQDSLHKQIGILPIITPYIQAKQQEIKKYQTIISQGVFKDIDTIMVEGKSDKMYLELAISAFSNTLQAKLDSAKLCILTRDEGCGTTLLCDWVVAWGHMGFSSKAMIILDRDEAGRKAKSEMEKHKEEFLRLRTSKIQIQHLAMNDAIMKIFHALPSGGKKYFNYEIEHLLSLDFWERTIMPNFAVERTPSEFSPIFETILSRDTTINKIIEDLALDDTIKNTIFQHNVRDSKKDSIFTKVERECSRGKKEIIFGLKPTVDKIVQYFE